MIRHPPRSTRVPYTALVRSPAAGPAAGPAAVVAGATRRSTAVPRRAVERLGVGHNGKGTDIPRRAASRTAKLAALPLGFAGRDRKSTRLKLSHANISYAVFR